MAYSSPPDRFVFDPSLDLEFNQSCVSVHTLIATGRQNTTLIPIRVKHSLHGTPHVLAERQNSEEAPPAKVKEEQSDQNKQVENVGLGNLYLQEEELVVVVPEGKGEEEKKKKEKQEKKKLCGCL
jgi:hypothetical protein